ncbi:FeoA domain-containing protein [uncultured Tyzzerella sp.]|uniref:FeoA family protein n=1 Tax=uncultured Tyzzerella sp. TaxID=2321398 RepID=UPI0029439C04|nr:FeoA domain-containing protein [uncultured Tyzzerella sp.]
MKELSQIEIGKNVKVIKVVGEGALKRRIMDMGITKDANIFLRKTAPLGDPIEISVRGYELTIRKEDAKIILVEECE